MRERTTDMEKYMETHHLITLAEKLLLYQHIVGCFEVCNEAERLAHQMDSESAECIERDYYLMKIKRIRIQLNNLMANELRHGFKGASSAKAKSLKSKRSAKNRTQVDV